MSQREYWCFISYRHVDDKEEGRKWATWLHQSLENYEVPEDLVGTQNQRGEIIPQRLFPVFRDEEELATGDLTQRIYEALDSAKTLVVICSPRARHSQYVEKEIRYFKRLSKSEPRQRIHSCIIDGDPNAPEDSDENCFPDALRYALKDDVILRNQPEPPLAADFRLEDGRQGWTSPEAFRRALEDQRESPRSEEIEKQVAAYGQQLKTSILRLIAGILGVPFGTLQARDKVYQLKLAQARARSLRRWLSAISTLAILVVSVGVFGYIQFREVRRGDRIASARQTLELGHALKDEDPVKALKNVMNGLSGLEKVEPQSLENAYEAAAEVVRSGRWARIGTNVRNILPMADGKSLLVVHGDNMAELIRATDLVSTWAHPDIRNVSPPWGPNSIWLTLGSEPVLDTRDGSFGLQPIRHVTEIKAPNDTNDWRFLVRYNQPGASCSTAFAECFITSINDDDEWAAVDSFVDRVDFASGKVEKIEDVYDVLDSPVIEVPCRVIRKNDGWHLNTGKNDNSIGKDFNRGSFLFSPKGNYVLATKDTSIAVFSCSTGDQRFLQAHDNLPAHAAFSADDGFLMLLIGSRAQIVPMPDSRVVAALKDDFKTVTAIRDASGPSSWLLSSDKGREVVAFRQQKLWRGLDSLDPSGRLAVLKESGGAFLDLDTGRRLTIPATGYAFSGEPDANYFAVFDRLSEPHASPIALRPTELDTGKKDTIDQITLREIANPQIIVHSFEKPQPEYGESQITFGQSDGFLYVTTYERTDNGDPPFQASYSHETEFFDARTGREIGAVRFVVKSCRANEEKAADITICQGSTNERNDYNVLLNNANRSILWVTESDGDKVEAVMAPANSGYFVVQFEAARGEIRRKKDGQKIGDLSEAISRGKFMPDGNHFVAWYKSGRCELWKLGEDAAVSLAPLGMPVSDVFSITGTDRLIVHYFDGRAYLIDVEWLSKIRNWTTIQIVESIRDHFAGPASAPWWKADYPTHYPWKNGEGAEGSRAVGGWR
ncbi:toll/interleukin-1 receptor domain-containing protein [Rhizobium leguminosarum]|uniref:toll/interleukin-1 receptor domain-containing protein n=1 Tax=Rhizobium leguminosarum TaxID=384 RepID=UPI0014426ACC|nr:toll/interleukin-1 receptor domain-containing protein [Rhizobium leguminosarum]NKL98678.1 TIR domain-containing protein [Rhizobium leguminosarum bv. viciae]